MKDHDYYEGVISNFRKKIYGNKFTCIEIG